MMSVSKDGRSSVSDQIVQFVCEFDGVDIPEDARHVMRLSLIDWVAVAVAGRNEPVARILQKIGEDEGGKPEAFCGWVWLQAARPHGCQDQWHALPCARL